MNEQDELAEWRKGYVVLRQEELKALVLEAVKAGGHAAVDDLLSLWSRKTTRNIGALGAIGVVVLTSWLSGLLSYLVDHIHWAK